MARKTTEVKKEAAKKGMMSLGELGFSAADKIAKMSGMEDEETT